METALTALIVIGVLLLATTTISDRSLSAQAGIAESSRAMQARAGERSRTNLTALTSSVSSSGKNVLLTIKNSGQVKLADITHWDVILQYSDGSNQQIKWYPYGTGTNQWSEQLYQVASPPTQEAFEPGIFNPGE